MKLFLVLILSSLLILMNQAKAKAEPLLWPFTGEAGVEGNEKESKLWMGIVVQPPLDSESNSKILMQVITEGIAEKMSKVLMTVVTVPASSGVPPRGMPLTTW